MWFSLLGKKRRAGNDATPVTTGEAPSDIDTPRDRSTAARTEHASSPRAAAQHQGQDSKAPGRSEAVAADVTAPEVISPAEFADTAAAIVSDMDVDTMGDLPGGGLERHAAKKQQKYKWLVQVSVR